MENSKPRLFIGSSSESLPVARFLQLELSDVSIPTIWNQSVILPGDYVLERLLLTVTEYDFGVFVFAGDDIATVRGERYLVARDNVILELGLFASRLGREHTFIVLQQTKPKVHLPSDLSGIVTANFDGPNDVPIASSPELHARVATAAHQIRLAITSRPVINKSLKPLSGGMVFIGLCLLTRAHGLDELTSKFKQFQDDSNRLSAGKRGDAYAAKATKYACQCLESVGLAEPFGGNEYRLTPAGKRTFSSDAVAEVLPTASNYEHLTKH
jgi:hypothetical protein